jgi:glutaredoxin
MIGNHYVLITKGSCPYCQEAIDLLKEREENFVYTDMENAPEILEVTKMASGHSTVPMVWRVTVGEDMSQPASNDFIGGCSELKDHLGLAEGGE